MLISFEGIDGSGKSNQAKLLFRALRDRKLSVILIREPGTSPIGQRIRSLFRDVRHREMDPMVETYLAAASRRQNWCQLTEPAIRSGCVVIYDRFGDSSLAYQGFGRGLPISLVSAIYAQSVEGREPDLTFLLDLPVEIAAARRCDVADRIEVEDTTFFGHVREGFLALANQNPHRIRVLDGCLPPEDLHRRILEEVLFHIGMEEEDAKRNDGRAFAGAGVI